MDMNETYVLLSVLKECLGHPKYQNIRAEAEKRLQEINDSPAKPVEQPPISEKPKAIPASRSTETESRRV